MSFNVAYFIKKFEGIPEKFWRKGTQHKDDKGRCCVLGHCRMVGETTALSGIFINHGGSVIATNDDTNRKGNFGHGEDHPRSRMLAALRWMYKKENH